MLKNQSLNFNYTSRIIHKNYTKKLLTYKQSLKSISPPTQIEVKPSDQVRKEKETLQKEKNVKNKI